MVIHLRLSDGEQAKEWVSGDPREDSDAPGYCVCEIRTHPPFAGEPAVERVETAFSIGAAAELAIASQEAPFSWEQKRGEAQSR